MRRPDDGLLVEEIVIHQFAGDRQSSAFLGKANFSKKNFFKSLKAPDRIWNLKILLGYFAGRPENFY